MSNMDICRFCGQAFIPNDENAPEAVRLDNGTSKCDCDEAKKWNRRRMFIASAQNKLHDVLKYKFNEAAEDEALNKSEGENVIYEYLQDIIPFMVDGDIPSVTLKIKGTGKVSMTVGSDGQIKIKRQISSAIEQKVSGMFDTLESFNVFFFISLALICLGIVFEEKLTEIEKKLTLKRRKEKEDETY